MDWLYLFGPGVFQLAAGFVIAKLFEMLSEIRHDRRIATQIQAERDRLDAQLLSERERLQEQLAAEKERLELQHRVELRKRLFDAKFETALRLTRMLQGSVQTLRAQMLLHGAAFSEAKVDVETFRMVRDRAYDSVQAALSEGEDAAAVAELLFRTVSFDELPHHGPLVAVSSAWQVFMRNQDDLLRWMETTRSDVTPRSRDQVAELDQELSNRLEAMRSRVRELLELVDAYHEGVAATIRILRDPLDS